MESHDQSHLLLCEKQQKEIKELKKQIEDLNEHRADHFSCMDIMLVENQCLEKQIKTLEDIHNGDMKIITMLKEKWNEEQEKNKELKKENEEQLAAVEALKFMDYTYNDGSWSMNDE